MVATRRARAMQQHLGAVVSPLRDGLPPNTRKKKVPKSKAASKGAKTPEKANADNVGENQSPLPDKQSPVPVLSGSKRPADFDENANGIEQRPAKKTRLSADVQVTPPPQPNLYSPATYLSGLRSMFKSVGTYLSPNKHSTQEAGPTTPPSPLATSPRPPSSTEPPSYPLQQPQFGQSPLDASPHAPSLAEPQSSPLQQPRFGQSPAEQLKQTHYPLPQFAPLPAVQAYESSTPNLDRFFASLREEQAQAQLSADTGPGTPANRDITTQIPQTVHLAGSVPPFSAYTQPQTEPRNMGMPARFRYRSRFDSPWMKKPRWERGEILRKAAEEKRRAKELYEKFGEEQQKLDAETDEVKAIEAKLCNTTFENQAIEAIEWAAIKKRKANCRAWIKSFDERVIAFKKQQENPQTFTDTPAQSATAKQSQPVAEKQAQPGTGRKRKLEWVKVDDLEFIPPGPPGTFGMIDKYFEQGEIGEDDWVLHDFEEAARWAFEYENPGMAWEPPAKKPRLSSSPSNPKTPSPKKNKKKARASTNSPANPFAGVDESTLGFFGLAHKRAVEGKPFEGSLYTPRSATQAKIYTGTMMGDPSPPVFTGNVFDDAQRKQAAEEKAAKEKAAQEKAAAEEAAEEQQSSSPIDMTDFIAVGRKYHVWIGPKMPKIPGAFQVPDDSDSDSEEEDVSVSQVSQKTKGALSSPRKATPSSNAGAQASLKRGADQIDATTSGNGMSIKGMASKQNVFNAFKPPSANLPDTEAVARARSQAEKHKPKTPSGLRATSFLASSPVTTPTGEADKTPAPPTEATAMDAGFSANGTTTPPGSPPGLSDNTTDEDESHPKTPQEHTSPTSARPMRSLEEIERLCEIDRGLVTQEEWDAFTDSWGQGNWPVVEHLTDDPVVLKLLDEYAESEQCKIDVAELREQCIAEGWFEGLTYKTEEEIASEKAEAAAEAAAKAAAEEAAQHLAQQYSPTVL